MSGENRQSEIGNRQSLSWELLAEGHAPRVFEWLPLIARREMMPGMAKIADGIAKNLADGRWQMADAAGNTPQLPTPISYLLEAIHSEERAARRAQKRGEKPPLADSRWEIADGENSAPTPNSQLLSPISRWLRGELAGYEPTLAWGILCQLQMRWQMKQHPAEADAAGKLYLSLRGENYTPEEIIKIGRLAERKARKLATDKHK